MKNGHGPKESIACPTAPCLVRIRRIVLRHTKICFILNHELAYWLAKGRADWRKRRNSRGTFQQMFYFNKWNNIFLLSLSLSHTHAPDVVAVGIASKFCLGRVLKQF